MAKQTPLNGPHGARHKNTARQGLYRALASPAWLLYHAWAETPAHTAGTGMTQLTDRYGPGTIPAC
jgi:hypothetical protein